MNGCSAKECQHTLLWNTVALAQRSAIHGQDTDAVAQTGSHRRTEKAALAVKKEEDATQELTVMIGPMQDFAKELI